MTPVPSKTMYPSRCPKHGGAELMGMAIRRSAHSIQIVNTRCKLGSLPESGSNPNWVTAGKRKLSRIADTLNVDELFCGAETFALGQTGDHGGKPVGEQAVLDFAGVDQLCIANWLTVGCEIGNQAHPNAVHVAPQPEPQAHAGRAIVFDNECGFCWAENGYVGKLTHDAPVPKINRGIAIEGGTVVPRQNNAQSELVEQKAHRDLRSIQAKSATSRQGANPSA